MKTSSLATWALALFSSIAFRLHSIDKLPWSQAVEEGLYLGWLNDFCFVSLLGLLAWLISGRSQRGARLFFGVGFGTLFLIQYAWTLYFSFFGTKLHLWIVQLHWRDSFALPAVAGNLSVGPWIITALICGALSLLLNFWSWSSKSKHGWLQITLGFLAIGLVVHLQQWPLNNRATVNRWHGSKHNIVELRAMAYDHALIHWLTDLDPRARLGQQRGVLTQHLSSEDIAAPWKLVATYRHARHLSDLGSSAPRPDTETNSRLLQQTPPNTDVESAWKKILGYRSPPKNLVVLYVESLRGFDFFHPEWGPAVFPGLHRLAQQRAVTFRQLYSSSWSAGQTVRGTFTTNCSFFDNVLGPATVIANSESRLLCAQKILSGLQKKTVFFSPTTPTFHNKRAFEQRHGTQEILGPRDYLPKEFAPPDSEVFGNRDPLIYPALLEKLRSLSRSSNGFFLHTINLSTHTPWSELKGLTFRNQDSSVSWPTDPVIRGYQDVFHRWDQEFSKFLESVLKEDWAQETLFLVLGDHSIPVPHTGVSAIANVDMRFRIPAFLFYPGIKKGLTLQGPFHQVDLMPTLFNIMALDDEPNTFLGQVIDPRKPEGSLWIFKEENSTLHFREKERFCSGTAENGGPCYRIAKGQDPLFDELADAPRASAEEFKKAMAFLEAINLVIGRDQVLPR